MSSLRVGKTSLLSLETVTFAGFVGFVGEGGGEGAAVERDVVLPCIALAAVAVFRAGDFLFGRVMSKN